MITMKKVMIYLIKRLNGWSRHDEDIDSIFFKGG